MRTWQNNEIIQEVRIKPKNIMMYQDIHNCICQNTKKKWRYTIHYVKPTDQLLFKSHNERHGVSNHQHLDFLLGRLFRRTPKKASKLCVTGLCEGNPPVTGGFPSQRASNAENVSVWWRHHVPYYWQFASRVHESLVGSLQKGPVMRKFVVFLVIILNKLLINQPCCLWFDTP